MLRVINFFKEPLANRNSLLFTRRSNPNEVYSGDMNQYIQNHQQLSAIKQIIVTGEKLGDGVYDSSDRLSEEKLTEFMGLVQQNKVESLSFAGCTLEPKDAVIIGEALKENNNLKKLEVTSNQLTREGMVYLLIALKQNKSLEELTSRSYNVQRYYWTESEIKALQSLLKQNQTLKNINLPDNQINKGEHIRMLAEVYQTQPNAASINGFEYRSSVTLPQFNRENALNGELEEKSRIRFIN